MVNQDIASDSRVYGGVWRRKKTAQLIVAIGPMDGRGDPIVRLVGNDAKDRVIWTSTGTDRYNDCSGNLLKDYEFVGMALDLIPDTVVSAASK